MPKPNDNQSEPTDVRGAVINRAAAFASRHKITTDEAISAIAIPASKALESWDPSKSKLTYFMELIIRKEGLRDKILNDNGGIDTRRHARELRLDDCHEPAVYGPDPSAERTRELLDVVRRIADRVWIFEHYAMAMAQQAPRLVRRYGYKLKRVYALRNETTQRIADEMQDPDTAGQSPDKIILRELQFLKRRAAVSEQALARQEEIANQVIELARAISADIEDNEPDLAQQIRKVLADLGYPHEGA